MTDEPDLFRVGKKAAGRLFPIGKDWTPPERVE